jgi:hypothetical protein
MMKKLLMACAVFMAGTAMMSAQFASIGIIGDATPTAWASDTDLTTTDGITYTIQNFTLGTGTVKFREADAWINNWGGATWPSGTGLFNSSTNIPSQPGLYNITFNRTTLAYNFEAAGNFATVTANVGGTVSSFFTTDGVTYYSNNIVVDANATANFTVNGASWGGAGFPSGTATAGGAAIAVPANSYNVVFNATTGAYSFNYVIISITGSGVGGWGTDTNMTTTDGVNYVVNSVTFTPDGSGVSEMKFRLNNDWGTTWGGGTYPSGTAEVVADGGNMAVPAGTYSVTFNRMTGAFAFDDEITSGIDGFTAATVVAFPNPTQNAWTFNAANAVISNVQIVDISGKVIISQSVNGSQAVVNASGLASGIYFAKINAGEASQTIRVAKN